MQLYKADSSKPFQPDFWDTSSEIAPIPPPENDATSPGKDAGTVTTDDINLTCSTPINDETVSPSGIGPRRCSASGSLFVKGNDYRRSTGTSSPFRKVLQHSRGSEELVRSELNKYSEYPKPIEVLPRPLLRRTTSLTRGLSSLHILEGRTLVTEQPSFHEIPHSTGYDSDSGSASENSETPSMGSRALWNKRRADRARRYRAVHAIIADTESDIEKETNGLELQRCWAEHVVDESIAPEYLTIASPAPKPGIPKKVHFAEPVRSHRGLAGTIKKENDIEALVPCLLAIASAISSTHLKAGRQTISC